MKKFSRLTLSILNIALIATLSGCEHLVTQPTDRPTLDNLMANANQASTAGQPDQAIILWREVAVAYPTSKAPWLKIAEKKYAAEQYGEAIINAQEVLARDPTDNVANSIVVVSGLRLATKSLKDLSTQNNLPGSILDESQNMVKLLRESLGDTVLVPVKPAHTTAAPQGQPKGTQKPTVVRNPFPERKK